MRIWLDRQALAARQLTVTDIEDALRRENVELPAGRIESKTREFTLRTLVGLQSEQDFRDLVDLARLRRSPDPLGRSRPTCSSPRKTIARRLASTAALACRWAWKRSRRANTLDIVRGVRAEIVKLQEHVATWREAGGRRRQRHRDRSGAARGDHRGRVRAVLGARW